MSLALELIGTMQYDQVAAVALSLRALGTSAEQMAEVAPMHSPDITAWLEKLSTSGDYLRVGGLREDGGAAKTGSEELLRTC